MQILVYQYFFIPKKVLFDYFISMISHTFHFLEFFVKNLAPLRLLLQRNFAQESQIRVVIFLHQKGKQLFWNNPKNQIRMTVGCLQFVHLDILAHEEENFQQLFFRYVAFREVVKNIKYEHCHVPAQVPQAEEFASKLF